MSDSEIFVIADTHFGHKNIIKFQAKERPFATIEEHDEALVRNWNETVRKQDTVYHLGDVLFGAHSFVHLARLNGTKKLVLGNHDNYPIARYMQYFTKVYSALEYRDALLTHIPVHKNQVGLNGRWRLNVHGHMHHERVMDDEYFDVNPWYRCVSVEHTNLRPVRLKEVIK